MWNNDTKLKAISDTNRRKEQYKTEIAKSIEISEIVEYKDTDTVKPRYSNTEIELVQLGSDEAVYTEFKNSNGKRVAVLNFASFKNPGGGYIRGAMAQEEALCHASTLYNILASEKFRYDYYFENTSNLNSGKYSNRHIYVKDVVFELHNEVIYPVDVITCAAPNKSFAFKSNNKQLIYELDTVMENRIDQVLYSAYIHNVDILILGAFGCGVFKNDPEVVARSFNELLQSKYKNVFSRVVFAIPSGKQSAGFKAVADKNLLTFMRHIERTK